MRENKNMKRLMKTRQGRKRIENRKRRKRNNTERNSEHSVKKQDPIYVTPEKPTLNIKMQTE